MLYLRICKYQYVYLHDIHHHIQQLHGSHSATAQCTPRDTFYNNTEFSTTTITASTSLLDVDEGPQQLAPV